MIDPVAEGIDPNPQSWEDIIWPISDRPNQSLNPVIYRQLRASYPDIDLSGELIQAFHYMLDMFDAPVDGCGIKKFLESWMKTNQARGVIRKEANQYFPILRGSD
ncbi:hypothetical protein [Endozoicomonas sp.]|uniref:hypothetical protein n=1 Tax=Endozoicomonas sp. TaxID=1892382 RepID=UPI003AF92C7F